MTRRPGCAPRPLARRYRKRPAPDRKTTTADVWDAARPAIGMITATCAGIDIGQMQAELLDGYPCEAVLEAMAHLATGFLRAAAIDAGRDEIVTDILQAIGLRAAAESSR